MALNLHRLYAHPSLTDGRTNGLAFSEFRNSEWRGKIGRTEIPHNSSNGRLDNDLILVCYYFIYLFCLFIPWFIYSSILSFIGYHHCRSISVLLAVLKLAPVCVQSFMWRVNRRAADWHGRFHPLQCAYGWMAASSFDYLQSVVVAVLSRPPRATMTHL